MKIFSHLVCVIALFLCACVSAGPKKDLPLSFLTVDGIHAGDNGVIYAAAGFDGSKVYEIAADGRVSEIADGLAGPVDIAKTSDSMLYVTNFFTKTLSRIDADGVISDFGELLEGPSGIASDSQDNLYISHFGAAGEGDTIIKVTPNGESSVFASGGFLQGPVGIAVDEYDNVYVANLGNGVITKIDKYGDQHKITQIQSENGFSIGHLAYFDGRIYATNLADGRIFVIRRDGKMRKLRASKRVELPNGITYNPVTGNIMVAEVFKPIATLVNIKVKR